MALQLVKAVKEQQLLRLLLVALSGGGKTYSALKVGTHLLKAMGKADPKILLLDSENQSSKHYAHLFDFYHHPVTNHDPREYIKLMKEAHRAGVDLVILDSMTHAWQRLIEIVDEYADKHRSRAGRKDNFSIGWRMGSPIYKEFVDSIINAPFHVIGTVRQKADYAVEDGKVQKLGLKAEARDGLEYEFDLAGELDRIDHTLTITKTRCEFLGMGSKHYQPGEEFASTLVKWLTMGEKVSVPQPVSVDKGEPVQEAKQHAPATASATAPDEDEKALNEHDWKAIFEAGKATGWTPVNIYSYAAAKYNVKPTQIASGITKWQGREIYKHVKENKPA